MLDRILTIINGPVYMGCYRTAEYERRQFIAAQIAYGTACVAIGVMIAVAFMPTTNM